MARRLSFVFVAIGDRYVAEAIQSAAKCKSVMPGCETMLLTDARIADAAIDVVLTTAYAGEDPFLIKVRGIRAIDRDRFVFLDTDTYVLEDIADIDVVLDDFDLAVAQAPVRHQMNLWPEQKLYLDEIPECFPEYNTGVIGIRRSKAMTAMLTRWEALYVKHMRRQPPPRTQDQASFRRALYESGLRIATLPTEYNCRVPYPASLCGRVKILHVHGTADYLERLGRSINRRQGFRVIVRERFHDDVMVLETMMRTQGATARGQ